MKKSRHSYGFARHARRGRQSRRVQIHSMLSATSVAAFAVTGAMVAVPTASAQEATENPALSTADGILAELERISRESESTSEKVTALDGDVAAKEAELREAEGALAQSESRVAAANDQMAALSPDISTYAKQRMRGNVVDPITTMLGASDAQDAIDRNSYVTQILRNKEMKISAASQARATAESETVTARKVTEEIAAHLADLNRQKDELNHRNDELSAQSDKVRAMVDALNPEQKALWVSKNNPITNGLDMLTGSSAAVDAALAQLGAPYEWGAAGPSAFDCSGLMVWAYQQIGKSIPRTSQAQLAGGTPVSRDQLQPGDIIGFYPGVTHVGMYIGDGKIVHASDYGIPVQVVSIDQGGPYQGAVRY